MELLKPKGREAFWWKVLVHKVSKRGVKEPDVDDKWSVPKEFPQSRRMGRPWGTKSQIPME